VTALIDSTGLVRDDSWLFVGEDEPLPANSDIIVSTARLLEEREALLARGGRLGVRIAPADAVEKIAELAASLDLIEIEFPAFRDGRGFSSARLLRDRFGYAGELRAVGDVLEDQLFFMLRCGFTEFRLKSADPQAAFARAARTFSAVYQSASDPRAPAHDLRRAIARRRESNK
jgi:uncharacterized protein (DUF934 family)